MEIEAETAVLCLQADGHKSVAAPRRARRECNRPLPRAFL